MEDYAFTLLSEVEGQFGSQLDKADWDRLLHALRMAVTNLRMNQLEVVECDAVLSELRAWSLQFDPHTAFHLLRLKATIERVRRLTAQYSDRLLALFPPFVISLGRLLGVAEHSIQQFCEGDIRGHIVFQLSKLTETALGDISRRLQLSPWLAVAPGAGSGRLIRCVDLKRLPSPKEKLILLLQAANGDKEIPSGVAGILLAQPIPSLSHLGVRARQLGIPFAATGEAQLLAQYEAHLDCPVHLVAEDTRLAIRSSASSEDLEQLASAGLHDSVIGVFPRQAKDAIRRVWASLWTRRAALSRSENAIPHADVHMAVLIQEMVEPEFSFVMHSADPISGKRGRTWVELAAGLGETLASTAQPGAPYRLHCDQLDGAISLLSCASFSLALRAAKDGGLHEERLDYSTIPLSRDLGAAQRLGARLVKVARFLEEEIEAPQDIEGVVAGDQIHIVQTRPQQGAVDNHSVK